MIKQLSLLSGAVLSALLLCGFDAGSRPDPIPVIKKAAVGAAGETYEALLAASGACRKDSITWKMDQDANFRRFVTLSCDAGDALNDQAKRLAGVLKSLSAHNAEGRKSDAFADAYGRALALGSDLEKIRTELVFKVYENNEFKLLADRGGLSVLFKGGAAYSVKDVTGGVIFADAAKKAPDFDDPMEELGFKWSKKSAPLAQTDLSAPLTAAVAQYAKSKNVAWSAASVTIDGKEIANPNKLGDEPEAAVKYHYFDMTAENARGAFETFLVPNRFHCNGRMDAKLGEWFADDPALLAEKDAFRATCSAAGFADAYRENARTTKFGLHSEAEVAEALKKAQEIAGYEVSKTNCVKGAFADLEKVIEESGTTEEQRTVGSALFKLKQRCQFESEPASNEIFKRLHLLEMTSATCGAGIGAAIRAKVDAVHSTVNRTQATEILTSGFDNLCRRKFPNALPIPQTPKGEGWVEPRGADEAQQLAALKYIEGYVDQYFCPDGKCSAEERRAYVQQEAEGFLRLASSRSERAEWAEPYFCGLLGFCSYGVMASQLRAAPAQPRAKASSNAKSNAQPQQAHAQRSPEKTPNREEQAPSLGKLVDDASSLVDSFSKIFK